MTAEVQKQMLKSFDGTDIASFRMGEKGRWVFLANGLGGNIKAWKHQLNYFKDSVRLVTWDYRGLYDSAQPAGGNYSIKDHVRDALMIMDHYEVEDAVVMGWSMGVQVALELYNQAPDRIKAIILLNGTNGKPLDDIFPRGKNFLKAALRHSAPKLNLLKGFASPLAQTKAIPAVMKTLGMVSGSLDEEIFLDISREFIKLDFATYVEIFLELAKHDSRKIFPKINVPTLVMPGQKDFITPLWMGKEMAASIPGSELTVVPGASHYSCVEYPDVVNLRIERFLKDHKLLR
jgi:pimeloyl-ACP methyl ester carboxylesterase